MPISNKEISDHLRKFADLLEIYAENHYRIRAYRRAARTILRLEQQVCNLLNDNFDLTTLPNIGPAIAKQIIKIVTTNQPLEVIINQNKSITSELQSSFSKKSNPQIYREKFVRYRIADLIINHLRDKLLSQPYIISVIPTSNYRRKVELVGTVHWIIQTTNKKQTMEMIAGLDVVKAVVSYEKECITVILRTSLLMTFHLVKKTISGASLIFYTGSVQHVSALNEHAEIVGSNIRFTSAMTKQPVGTEKDLYNELGLAYIEPELRENRGELLAAKNNNLPHLVSLTDIKGDLHSHTNETDGIESIEVMVEAASQLGYEYFAITDHSKRLAISNGLDEKRLLKQIELIDKLNETYPNITILKSIEVDILEDGSLDLSNEVLAKLDLRVCSIHSKFKLPEEKQTERIIRAMDNPYFNILGHMTGRLLTSRPAYMLQIEKIFIAAKDRACCIELNAQPSRLDIHDIYCKQAKELGVKIAISSDAHSVRELSFMQYGINQARRGWLEKKDVINTRTLADLRKIIQRK